MNTCTSPAIWPQECRRHNIIRERAGYRYLGEIRCPCEVPDITDALMRGANWNVPIARYLDGQAFWFLGRVRVHEVWAANCVDTGLPYTIVRGSLSLTEPPRRKDGRRSEGGRVCRLVDDWTAWELFKRAMPELTPWGLSLNERLHSFEAEATRLLRRHLTPGVPQ